MKKGLLIIGVCFTIIFLFAMVFLMNDKANALEKKQSNVKNTKFEKFKIINKKGQYGIKFYCHAGPSKIIKISAKSYNEALDKARGMVEKQGCKMPAVLHYGKALWQCANPKLWKVEGKMWARDNDDIYSRMMQVIKTKGYTTDKCNGGGGMNLGNSDEDSKAALRDAQDEWIWK